MRGPTAQGDAERWVGDGEVDAGVRPLPHHLQAVALNDLVWLGPAVESSQHEGTRSEATRENFLPRYALFLALERHRLNVPLSSNH